MTALGFQGSPVPTPKRGGQAHGPAPALLVKAPHCQPECLAPRRPCVCLKLVFCAWLGDSV